MAIKEIKELEDELKEISVEEPVVEIDEVEDSEEEDSEEEEAEEFSIGDTMLARGEAKERWNNESLEDAVGWESSDDFEEEEGGFSYEPMSEGSGELYGSSDIGDLYGSEKSSDLYNNNEETAGEGDFYNAIGTSGKEKVGIVNYEVAGGKNKKKKRRGGKSGLESGARGKRSKRKGVSLI